MILRNLSILIFADTDSLFEAGQAAARDERLAKSTVQVQSGGALQAAEWLASNPSPDVLIVGDPADDEMWGRLETLAGSVEANCKVIVVGHKDSIAIYRSLVAQGVADYLGGAVKPAHLIEALSRMFLGEDNLPKGKLVVTLSAVGGAGGSITAAVLADALGARLGDPILLDLDLSTGTDALVLGVDVRDSVAGAMANPGLDIPMLERFVVRHGKVRLLSTSGSLRDVSAFNADSLERVLMLTRGMAKVVVADLPRGWGEEYERALSLADEIVIVATPELAALRNTRMILDELVARRAEGPRAKVILNKMGMAKRNEYGADDFKEAIGMPPAALIPWDPEPLLAAVAEGRPVINAPSKATAALRVFADKLLPMRESRPLQESKASIGLLTRWRGMLAKTA